MSGAYPVRRRPKGPLHPSYRAAPAEAEQAPIAAPLTPGEGSSRKRAWLAAQPAASGTQPGAAGYSAGSHASTSYGASSQGSAIYGASYGSTHSLPFGMARGSSYSNGLDAAGPSRVGLGPTRSTSGYSVASSADGGVATTSAAGEHTSPRGAGAWETLTRAQATQAAAAAQARERQTRARQLEAGGALADGDAQGLEDEAAGPATKRRRGVAGAIVSGALNTALYAGAAAITAYSLWSSWGRQPAREAGEDEKSPPGALRSDASTAPPLSPSASSSASSAPTRSSSTHVYLSRTRRRPAFPSSRSARSITRPLPPSWPSAESLTASSSAPVTPALETAPEHGMEEDEDDEDDELSRMSKRMEAMIAEGQKALSAKAELLPDESMEPSTPPQPTASAQRFGYAGPSYSQGSLSRSAARVPTSGRGNGDMHLRSASQVDFAFAGGAEPLSPTSPTPPSRAAPFVFGAGTSHIPVASGLTPASRSPYARQRPRQLMDAARDAGDARDTRFRRQ